MTDNIIDAVKYSQKRVNALDSGVIKLDVPKDFFNKYIEPFKDIRYSDNDYWIKGSDNVIREINNFINK